MTHARIIGQFGGTSTALVIRITASTAVNRKENQMKLSKSLTAHADRLANPKHVWKKSEINALSKCINSARWEQNQDVKEFKLHLLAMVNGASFQGGKITEEQTKFGKEWLNRTLFNAKGELRKSKAAREFSFSAVEIVKNLKSFKFMGFHTTWNSYSQTPQIQAPVYRAIAKNGDSFDYAPIHWGPCLINGEIEMSCV